MDVECPGCGSIFACKTEGGCWCNHLPKLKKRLGGLKCFCPKCLSEIIAKQDQEERQELFRGLRNS